jgi:hypothetical protein
VTREEAAKVTGWLRATWPDDVFDEQVWWSSALGDCSLLEARRIRNAIPVDGPAPTPAGWNQLRRGGDTATPVTTKAAVGHVQAALAEARAHLTAPPKGTR